MPSYHKYVHFGHLVDEAFGEHLKADQKFTADKLSFFLKSPLLHSTVIAILDKNVDATILL